MTANPNKIPNKILDRLTERFAPADAVSRQQFREYLGISISTDCRLKKSGHYPTTVNVAGSEKILLIDLAAWLDASGSPAPAAAPQGRGRGRPKGSRNKPKPIPSHFPTLPAPMAAAFGVACTA